MAGKTDGDAERVFTANGVLAIVAVLIGAAVFHLDRLTMPITLFLLLSLAICMAVVVQLHGIRPVNVIRPGLEGVASIISAFRVPRGQEPVRNDDSDVLDLTPYRVVDHPNSISSASRSKT